MRTECARLHSSSLRVASSSLPTLLERFVDNDPAVPYWPIPISTTLHKLSFIHILFCPADKTHPELSVLHCTFLMYVSLISFKYLRACFAEFSFIHKNCSLLRYECWIRKLKNGNAEDSHMFYDDDLGVKSCRWPSGNLGERRAWVELMPQVPVGVFLYFVVGIVPEYRSVRECAVEEVSETLVLRALRTWIAFMFWCCVSFLLHIHSYRRGYVLLLHHDLSMLWKVTRR